MLLEPQIKIVPETATHAARRRRRRKTLGLIGTGAFGAFIIPHLTPHFDVVIADAGAQNLAQLAADHWVRVGDTDSAATQDIVVLAVPLGALEEVARRIAPRLRPGTLVIDVCSVKIRPLEILHRMLPADVEIVGSHPLFGPQSGHDGIAGLNIALCGEGRLARHLQRFLERRLSLRVVATTPEQHDRQMAHVQGLTHLLSRIVLQMELPPMAFQTATFESLLRMVEMVRHDSDDLFRVITSENPFVGEVIEAFLSAAQRVAGGIGAEAIRR